MGPKALMELNDAIYESLWDLRLLWSLMMPFMMILKVMLKVTKNAKNVQINILWCKWWWWMSLSLCSLSCVFFISHMDGPEINSSVTFLLFFSSSKWSWKKSNGPWRFNHYMTVHGTHYMIQMWWSWKKSIGWLLSTMYVSDGSWKKPILFVYAMVLKWVNFRC